MSEMTMSSRNMALTRIPAKITRRDEIANDILLIEFSAEYLPSWTAGSHIDVNIPDYGLRSYSLVDGDYQKKYRIAVKIIQHPGSASLYIRDHFHVGTDVVIYPAINRFPIKQASRYTFLAAGIGVTPIISMLRQLDGSDAVWKCHYFVRNRDRIPFIDDLRALAVRANAELNVYVSAESGRQPLAELFAHEENLDAVYACGPTGFMKEAEVIVSTRGGARFYMEDFDEQRTEVIGEHPAPICQGKTAERISSNSPFEVECRASGRSFTVAPHETILDYVKQILPDQPYSCEEGVCGTCEVSVLEGIAAHRDQWYSDEARANGGRMMICVSRSKTKKIVLDL
ncbi:PDR/VanB family oxidoreductase [Burkholderia plantarii]|uniref:PDR/VanB family oxidoreductase n=1 Tax=Burkholderia plantarii TaxID=41899 RepID=UPI0006D8B26C|nr:PDR/VanB family oxidoreductase [Burkholderia plantarii]ALK35260.1 iron-sulfur oxidoreductase [Burkholderia plantarii]WLE64220.1 oxidoreductase [Burkholderia plantarii]GLZ23277.1 iron-sulfur protein [Burkholderia plantarii]